ncbi:MAG TPA: hypothetical protein VNV18_17415 [Stellaceae bacterium]|jgi:hypothetical protein|nr:hypothetical protein [Stellaceae bacterium]
MSVDLYVGPLIERNGSFGYDTFSRGEGLRSSFRYRRIEQARHDQRALVAESQRVPHLHVHTCETLVEFERAVAAERNIDGDPDANQDGANEATDNQTGEP